jgi:hypothetical protein
MKKCNTCSKLKPLSEYGPHKTSADGYNPKCKMCVSEYNRTYRNNNADKIKTQTRAYSAKTTLRRREVTKKWNKENKERKKKTDQARYNNFKAEGRLSEYYGNVDKERNKQRARMWRQMNQGRVNATIARRRSSVLKATPPWAEYDQIIKIYQEARRLTVQTGIPHEVDHIIPLKSKIVCGLHCMSNLQILTADENNKKKCKVG